MWRCCEDGVAAVGFRDGPKIGTAGDFVPSLLEVGDINDFERTDRSVGESAGRERSEKGADHRPVLERHGQSA